MLYRACFDNLSEMERSVLERLSAGDCHEEIANRLGITVTSVRAILRSLVTAAGVRTSHELVAVYARDRASVRS